MELQRSRSNGTTEGGGGAHETCCLRSCSSVCVNGSALCSRSNKLCPSWRACAWRVLRAKEGGMVARGHSRVVSLAHRAWGRHTTHRQRPFHDQLAVGW